MVCWMIVQASLSSLDQDREETLKGLSESYGCFYTAEPNGTPKYPIKYRTYQDAEVGANNLPRYARDYADVLALIKYRITCLNLEKMLFENTDDTIACFARLYKLDDQGQWTFFEEMVLAPEFPTK